MQITVPEIVPIATENLVILVFVARAKGRELWKDSAKLLTRKECYEQPDLDFESRASASFTTPAFIRSMGKGPKYSIQVRSPF